MKSFEFVKHQMTRIEQDIEEYYLNVSVQAKASKVSNVFRVAAYGLVVAGVVTFILSAKYPIGITVVIWAGMACLVAMFSLSEVIGVHNKFRQGEITSLGFWFWTESKASRQQREAARARMAQLEQEIGWASEKIILEIDMAFTGEPFAVLPYDTDKKTTLGVPGTEFYTWLEPLTNTESLRRPLVLVRYDDGREEIKALTVTKTNHLVVVEPAAVEGKIS